MRHLKWLYNNLIEIIVIIGIGLCMYLQMIGYRLQFRDVVIFVCVLLSIAIGLLIDIIITNRKRKKG